MMLTAMKVPMPARSSPSEAAYTAPMPQNAPSARPASTAPAAALGAARQIASRCTFGATVITGGESRVALTGRMASANRIATTLNSTGLRGGCRSSNSWPAARASSETTMYTPNTRLRCSGAACAFNQLSITVHSPTSDMPVTTRSSIHPTGSLHSGYTSTAAAASAAWNAKARMWPTRRIRGGAVNVPRKKPTK